MTDGLTYSLTIAIPRGAFAPKNKENHFKNATPIARENLIGVTKTKLDNSVVDLRLSEENEIDLTCGGDGGTGF